MKVVLKQDIKGTGKKDQMVEVSDGYARNFLFPRKLAVPADAANANDVKNKAEAKQYHLDQERAAAQKLADSVNAKGYHHPCQGRLQRPPVRCSYCKGYCAGDQESYGVELDKRKIVLDADIKAYGCYPVTIKIYTGITAQVTVNVLE